MAIIQNRSLGHAVTSDIANAVFQTANNTGVWDLNKTGISLTSGNTAANISINTTSTAASLILGISKTAYTTANTY